MIGNRRCALALSTAFTSILPLRPHLRPSSTVEHGRRDYPRPLRKNPDGLGISRGRFYSTRGSFVFLPGALGRPRFCLGPRPDEGSGWPAHRPWGRTVQSVSGQRDVGRKQTLRSLLGRLERCSLLMTHGLLGVLQGGVPCSARAWNGAARPLASSSSWTARPVRFGSSRHVRVMSVIPPQSRHSSARFARPFSARNGRSVSLGVAGPTQRGG
jgi:hypothetical protein